MLEDSQNENQEKQDIEIVNGNGSELELSPVFEHLNVAKPKTKNENDKKKEIIIPKTKNEK